MLQAVFFRLSDSFSCSAVAITPLMRASLKSRKKTSGLESGGKVSWEPSGVGVSRKRVIVAGTRD